MTTGVTGCAQATTTSAGSPSIAAPDLERIASGNKSPAGASSPGASATSGASSSGQFVVPEAAKAHTKEGAVAFMKFYRNMLEQLDTHPQTGVIPKFAVEGCKACQNQEAHYKRLDQEKAVVATTAKKCDPETVRPDSSTESVVVQIRCTDQGTQHLSASRVIRSYPPAAFVNEFRADWNGKEWTLGEAAAHPSK